MSYVLAIDVGTSFTAAAIARFDQGSPPAPECLPLGLRGTSVPSVLYYPEDGPILVGEAAERRGLDSPARVLREFKRRVGDSVPISVGALALPPEDVFATMARWVADRAEEREGAPPSEVILTHPAAWGSHRTSVILAAMAARGLENATLITEPEAAALYYASQVRVEDGSIIAVYDLGGGTFDTAVLRKAGSSRFELVGRPEGIENLGGADFDAEVFRYVAAHTGDALRKLDPADAGVRGALARLRRECVEAKEALSADSEANISVLLPGVQQQVRLVRSEFEALIEAPLRDTVDALEQSLAGMELKPADLSAVLLIGGSSRIPLVAQLISEQLDRPIAVDADPKSSICMGAAVSAVLARTEVSKADDAAADAVPAKGALTAAGLLAPAGNTPARRASWSRHGAASAGAAAAAATAHGHSHGGAHAPRPAVRLTAIAAAAALVSVLTATAAQSPGGLGSLASILSQQAEAAPGTESSLGGSGGAGGGAGPGQGAAAAGGAPVAGIEAGVDLKAAPAGGAGLDVEASPTSGPSSSAAPGTSQAGGSSAGGAAPDPGTGAPASESGTSGGALNTTGTPDAGADAGTAGPIAPGTTGPVAEEPTQEPAPPPVVQPTQESPQQPPVVEPTAEPTQEPAPPPVVQPTQEPTQVPTQEPTQVPAGPEPTSIVTQSGEPAAPTGTVTTPEPATSSVPGA